MKHKHEIQIYLNIFFFINIFFHFDCTESLTGLDTFVHELGCDELKAMSLYSAFFIYDDSKNKYFAFLPHLAHFSLEKHSHNLEKENEKKKKYCPKNSDFEKK